MRFRLIIALGLVAAGLAMPTTALAGPSPSSPSASKWLLIVQGSPVAQVQSLNTVPLHWTSSASQAIHAAERSPLLRSLHRRMHPLNVVPYVWRGPHPYWYVVFWYRDKHVADANVSPAGKLTGAWTGLQALEPYTHGDVAGILTTPLILVPASLLFMLCFFDPRRPFRMATLDGLAILSLLASYLVLSAGHLAVPIWLAYPPLVYLLVRLLQAGFGKSRGSGRLAPLLSYRTLLIGLPVLLVARILLSLFGHEEIDIGYESVIGAFRILHHAPIYYNDQNHGDTYGPITYLAYVPFQLLFPWKNGLNNLRAADVASIVFDLGTVIGLVFLGRRLRPGLEGRRLGLILGWAWAACPFTVIGVLVHTNDALITMLSVLVLLLIARPAVSGAVLGLATAAKFSPAALLPLIAAPRQRGIKGALVCCAAFTAVVVTAIYSWLPPGGFGYFWQETIGFQMTRPDMFSPWGLVPALHPLQTGLEVLAVLLVAAVAFVPRARSLWQTCALAGALTLAVQLPASHWYYYYILWFLPFALPAFLLRPAPAPVTVTEEADVGEAALKRGRHEPVLAGA